MKYVLILLLGLTVTFGENVIQEVTDANNLEFTASVYKELLKARKGDNFLISPFSAETALAFTLSGCKGDTAVELRTALGLPDSEKTESAFRTILPTLKSSEDYSLHTANKLYVAEDLVLTESFKKTAAEVYQSESENINFEDNEEAAKTINDWVERLTNNKIQDLISSDDLDENTKLALINALYFKANWSTRFKLAKTKKGPFHRSAADVVQVDTMNIKTSFKYYECPHLNAKFLEMPFQGDDASMTILLPNEKQGLAALEDKIDRVFVPHNLTFKFVEVSLPKFKIDSDVDFKSILQNLGVESAFDEKLADLSGIAGSKGDLVIDIIRQKTFIDVSEEGVEAAAATFVLDGGRSGLALIPAKVSFIVDQPFIFYVKIKGVIAFVGRVTSPNY